MIGLFAGASVLGGLVFFFWYYGSPRYTDVGYKPDQPIKYSHKFHVQSLGLDCRYCHSFVEVSHEANVPSTNTCINCHEHIEKESYNLTILKNSAQDPYEDLNGDGFWSEDEPFRDVNGNGNWDSGEPINWVKIHMLPDYAYFNHSVHLNIGHKLIDENGNGKWDEGEEYDGLGVGVGCVECHGRIDQMEVVAQAEPLNMLWCLDCHRDPVPRLRPISEITNMDWEPDDSWKESDAFVQIHKKIEPSQDCSACHR